MGDIYVPLHVHTHHSILDGFATGHENADRAKAIGAPAVAMTDHGSCSGHWEHTLACRRNAIKPIYGIETYLVDSVKASKERRDKPSDFAHACMWALTDEGLSNLWAASSIATDPDHMYYKPRMDFELLEKYHEGCAISDGCLLSTVARAIVDDDLDKARAHLGRLVSVFGQENVLVELHTWQFINPLTDEHIELNRQMTKANKGKLKLAKELGLRTIAVNDSHYSVKEDYAYHEISWAGNKGRATDQIFDPDDDENDGVGGRGETASWMMTADEVRLYLGRHGIPADDINEAIDNTVWLANRCDAHIESHARFPLMTGTEDGDNELFDKMLEEGFKKKVPQGKEAEYRERLEYEKNIIKGSHFPGYFNTVADYIKYCKEPDHAGVRGHIVGKEPTITGAGRGSGAGSLCTYLLDITEVDPIPFGLYFERFLTPARKMEDGWSVWYDDGTEEAFRPSDMPEGLKTGSKVNGKTVTGVFPAAIGEFPDIDSDFPSSFGDDMIRYLEKRHGRDNVAHLGNFLYTRPKSTFRTISKAFGVKDQKFVSEITDRFMDELNDDDFLDEDKKILDEAKDLSPAHRKLVNRVWPHMQRMRSRVRALGTHASGVIIANEPLLGAIPLRWANDGWVTAFDHDPTEALGYIKYDVLKVTSLDILDLTAQLAVQDRKVFREVWDNGTEHYLPKELLRDPDNAEVVTEPTIKVVTEASNGWFNNPDVWERTRQGDSFGLFQLETDSGQGFAKRMQIKNVRDAAMLSAVNRPGVVRAGLIDTFFKRRDGFERVTYPHPMLEQIIGDTGGLFVFQESVLQMFQLMCGYSLEQADGVRKIITKKKVKEMPRLHDEFVEACKANPDFVSQVPKRFRSVEDCCEEVWEMMVHTAEYSFGKSHCVHSNTNIMLGNEEVISIAELYKRFESGETLSVMSMYPDGSVRPGNVSEVMKSGLKEVLTVRLENGRILRATKDHKLLTVNGYKKIGDMKAGDIIIFDEDHSYKRTKLSETMKRTQSKLTFEDRSRHQKAVQALHPHRTDNWIKAQQESMARLRQDPEFVAAHGRKMSEVVQAYWDTVEDKKNARNWVGWAYMQQMSHEERSARASARASAWWKSLTPEQVSEWSQHVREAKAAHGAQGFGIPTQLSDGRWCDSILEAEVGEYLLSRGLLFDMHSIVPGTKRMCDFYLDGLYIEVDGLNRGEQFFRDRKYGDDLPFLVVTPMDWKEKIDAAISHPHVENGVAIASIKSEKLPGRWGKTYGMTYDITMADDSPANFIANGIVTHNSVAYAYTSGWGAYMKTYFLPEFVAAAMTYKQKDLVKTASYSKRVGIPVLGPDINLSSWRYTIEDDSIRLPLSQVPNVGGSAMEDILAGQPYKDFEDYCERTSNSKGRKVNVLKNLVLAGAFDSFNPDRTEMYRDAMAAKGRKDDEPPIMRTKAQVAKVEEELLGLPISYDPMNEVEGHFKGYAVKSIDEVTSTPVGGNFFAYGKVTKIRRHKAKSGWMAWVELRLKDFSTLSVTVFPSMFSEVAHLFSESDVLLVKCRRDKDYNGRLSVICDQLVNFTDYLE